MRNTPSLIAIIAAAALAATPRQLSAQERPIPGAQISRECNSVLDGTIRSECDENALHVAALIQSMQTLVANLGFTVEVRCLELVLSKLGDVRGLVGDLAEAMVEHKGAIADGGDPAAAINELLDNSANALIRADEKAPAKCTRTRTEAIANIQMLTAAISDKFAAIEKAVPYLTKLSSWGDVKKDFEKRVTSRLPGFIEFKCPTGVSASIPPAPDKHSLPNLESIGTRRQWRLWQLESERTRDK